MEGWKDGGMDAKQSQSSNLPTFQPSKPVYLHCSLCGFEFEKHQTTCATGCPMGKYCKLVRCPSCGYEFPEPSEPLTWFARLFGRKHAPPPERKLISLDELEDGEQCELVCLNGAHVSRRTALAVYGLVPGCQLVLQQKSPSVVIRVGETELALEGNIAHEIFVKRLRG
jgi:Fe2+ transport system protein FeoA